MSFNRVPLAVRTQALLFLFAVSVPLAAQERLNRYALLLNDPPLAAVESFGKAGPRAASADARARVAAAQTSLRAALAERNITVLGSADTVVNAVFVYSPDAAALAALPGVRRVVPMETHKAHMVKAGSAVVDVGMNRLPTGLCGDVDFDAVKEVSGLITPVPGGVGKMTVAMLLWNTALSAERGLTPVSTEARRN